MSNCAPLIHPWGKVQLLLKGENYGNILGRAAGFVIILCVYFEIEATGISSDSKESLKIRREAYRNQLVFGKHRLFFNWKINLYRNSC